MKLETLERACLEAWPALNRDTRDGWEYCATTGHSGRVNSIWPIAWSEHVPLNDAIDTAASWCAWHKIAPTFKLTDGLTFPHDLPHALAQLGYAPHSETLIMTAPVSLGPAPRAPVTLYDSDHEQFWAPLGQSAHADDTAERVDIVRRIRAPHIFALNYHEGAPASAGLGVLTGDLIGIYLMRTAPFARRKGHARQVLRALTHWGATHEATSAYLQVEEANAAAVNLYESEGFTTAGRYRYWSRARR
ncbi:MAG: GNAT family N-acetyltransferase [Terricaulis sp.]